ncbi:MAG: hypothetical protein K9I26_08540 [Flavobacterium sp.]|nr:hypothetical protein [Flavobacterium sp.]
MTIESTIIRSIDRSSFAYELYKVDKMYYQALRIFRANKKLYDLLVEYSFLCEDSIVKEVHNYIFHLEDWFEQFNHSATSSVQLEDVFAFEKLKNSISFPSDFINKLNSL